MLHQAITLHPQPRYSSPAECLTTIPLLSPVVVSRLETWSDSAPEETYASYSPIRDSDGLRILLTRPPGDHQILFSRIYAQDSPVEYLLTPPAELTYEIFSNVFLDLYHLLTATSTFPLVTLVPKW